MLYSASSARCLGRGEEPDDDGSAGGAPRLLPLVLRMGTICAVAGPEFG